MADDRPRAGEANDVGATSCKPNAAKYATLAAISIPKL
jgi:hypothetical protein